MRFKALSRASWIGLIAIGAVSGASAEDVVKLGKGVDIATLCGSKPASVAMIDGVGDNTWRKITKAEMLDEASKCANIERTAYSDAGGDPQKYNSDINSFVAQGYDIIIAFADFGDASLPAFRSALQAGAVVVPYNAQLSGAAGVDYTANPHQKMDEVGRSWASWVSTNLKKGNVVMLGGTPGAATSQLIMDGFKDGLKSNADLKLLDENYIVTNWNPADAQKAVAGLIAKYPQIDAIAADSGITALAAVKAFEQAGLPVPAIAALASDNQLNCKFVADKAAGKAWSYMALDGTTTVVRFALRQGLAAFEAVDPGEPVNLVPMVSADSFADVAPPCDEKAPPDADLSSLLSPEQLQQVFQ